MKKFLRGLSYFALAIAALFVVMVIKTLLAPVAKPPPKATTALVPIASEAEQQRLAETLGQALRIQTVSTDKGPADPQVLRALHAHLQASFPTLWATLKRETVNDFGLIFTWPGQDSARKPYLLLAHQDVVPVEPGTESRWQEQPFSGAIKDGYVWGRGAMDDKFSMMAILEALERLIKSGYQPQRTLYLALGQDEEIHGRLGAVATASLFQQRGIRFDFVLDEGPAVTQGIMPGIKRPVALIAVAEKGYMSVELTVQSTGGHSSIPPAHTAAGILAQAITRLENHQMPATLSGPTGKLFAAVGSELPFGLRLVMSNLWLLKPVLLWQLSKAPTTNAAVRTTTAVTMLEGSPKDNVLPQRARAVVNFRLLPGNSSESVLLHIRDVIADPRVEIQPLRTMLNEATPESSSTSSGFNVISATIAQHFPDALIGPSLNLAAADARHYVGVADDVYRFVPLILLPEDLSRFHGTNERIAVSAYARSVAFYEQLVRNADTGL